MTGTTSGRPSATDADGEFSVTETECDDRQVKVEARVRERRSARPSGSQQPGLVRAARDAAWSSRSTIDLHAEPFGGETGEQSTTQARTDAQTWIVYRKCAGLRRPRPATAAQQRHGQQPGVAEGACPGGRPDPPRHPHRPPTTSSSIDTMLHELGHIWAYPRETGEKCLTWAAVHSANTHETGRGSLRGLQRGVRRVLLRQAEQDMNRPRAHRVCRSSSRATCLTRRNP